LMETRTRAGVADVALTEALHFHEDAVLITIDDHLDDAKLVAGCFALGPEHAARAAKKRREAGAPRFFERLLVHEADHEDFGCFRVLNHCRDEAV